MSSMQSLLCFTPVVGQKGLALIGGWTRALCCCFTPYCPLLVLPRLLSLGIRFAAAVGSVMSLRTWWVEGGVQTLATTHTHSIYQARYKGSGGVVANRTPSHNQWLVALQQVSRTLSL